MLTPQTQATKNPYNSFTTLSLRRFNEELALTDLQVASVEIPK